MDRRQFLTGSLALLSAASLGCRGSQHAHVLKSDDADMVGSHTAGAETWEPLIQQSVSQLLGRQHVVIQTAGGEDAIARKRICFVGVENKSAEEIGEGARTSRWSAPNASSMPAMSNWPRPRCASITHSGQGARCSAMSAPSSPSAWRAATTASGRRDESSEPTAVCTCKSKAVPTLTLPAFSSSATKRPNARSVFGLRRTLQASPVSSQPPDLPKELLPKGA